METLTINSQVASGVLLEAAPTTVQATSTGSHIGQYAAGALLRTVMPFDFSLLPAGAVISSAILTLTIYGSAYNTSLYAYRIVRTDCNLSYLCWNNYKSGSAWATAGCNNSSTDHTTTNGASVAVLSGFTGTKTLTLTDMVKYAQANTGNILWIRLHNNTEATAGAYTSVYSRYSTTGMPSLAITYTVATRNNVMLF
jgi:hypothetical protein